GHLPVALVEQARALPGLVRGLVVGEARVAVDAEQRAAHFRRVGAEMRAHPGQRDLQVAEQALERLAHVGLVVRLVGLAPGALVVAGQGAEELQALVGEVGTHASEDCSCRPQRSSWSSSARRSGSEACWPRSVAMRSK